jgi:RNA polymerase sigma-70 factor (ECF subfamily)
MSEHELNQRLSRIETMWSVVNQAHQGPVSEAAAAQQQLLQRYSSAIYRYILGAVRDLDAADEVFQEFALRFVKGSFQRADPQRGRFRDLVRTSVRNLITNHFQRRQGQPRQLAEDAPEPACTDEQLAAADQAFVDRWREELLNRTWDALARVQEQTGQLFHLVLRCRAEHADWSSAQMAEHLGSVAGRPLTAAGVRQTLHRAREKFAELLLEEVARSLETNDREPLEQELAELGLLSYCRSALARHGKG